MPEPSEWLVAEGGTIETLGIVTPTIMGRTRISLATTNAFAPFKRFSFDDGYSWDYANAPHPGYEHSGFALGIQPFRLDTYAAVRQ